MRKKQGPPNRPFSSHGEHNGYFVYIADFSIILHWAMPLLCDTKIMTRGFASSLVKRDLNLVFASLDCGFESRRARRYVKPRALVPRVFHRARSARTSARVRLPRPPNGLESGRFAAKRAFTKVDESE